MNYIACVLFAGAFAFMVHATVRYEKAIKTRGLPGAWFNGKPLYTEGKKFRLWSSFGLNLFVGIVLFSNTKPLADFYLIAYSLIGPLVHWLYLSAVYRWSLKQ